MRLTSLVVDQLKVQVKRSGRRKTLLLRVHEDHVQVNAPLFTSNIEIELFVNEHRTWITTQLQKIPQRPHFTQGEDFLYLGRPYTLRLLVGKRDVYLSDNSLIVSHPNSDADTTQRQIKQFLRKKADEVLLARVRLCQRGFDSRPSAVMVKSYRARWGSCSEQGLIQLNWKLIMAPVNVIDYVVIHELCHLYHFNHSKRFWAKVRAHCEHYVQYKKWLAENGRLLTHVF